MTVSSARIVFIAVLFLLAPLLSNARVIPDVGATGSVLGTSTICPNLTRNLSFGSRGNDVVQLQEFLIAQGHLATGNNTGYFGSLTRAAVRKFQCREMNICSGSEITNGYGVVGSKTRAVIQSVCSTQASPHPTAQPPIAAQSSPICEHPNPPEGCSWQKGATCAEDKIVCSPVNQAPSCPVPVKVYSDANSANYPRMVELSDGRIFLGFSGTANGQGNVLGYVSSDEGATWQKHSVVAEDASRSFFAPMFYEVSPGNILAAYYQRCAAGVCNIAVKDALYSGVTWQTLGTIQTGGLDWGDGVYEPFWFKKDSNTLQLYYADETTTKLNGVVKGQNIMMEERNISSLSGDWNAIPTQVAKGNTKDTQYGDRYGVPSVTRMRNGNLIAIFESTLGVANGGYGLGYSISSNNGAGWTNPTPLLNVPPGKSNAGGPSITKLSDGALVVTFSDSESNTTALTNARMRYIYSMDNGTTWYTNGGRGYSLFDDYGLYGSIIQLRDGKIIAAKGSQTDWIPGGDNSIYVKTYVDKSQFLSCTSAPGNVSPTFPPAPPVPPTPPPAPASMSYSCAPSGTSVTFSWPGVATASKYRPFVKNLASCPAGWSQDVNAPGTCYQTGITETSVTLSGITPGTNYVGWIHSENVAGVNWSAMASTNWFSCPAPVPAAPPPAPASVSYSCSAGGTTVTLSWPTVAGATAYWPFIKNVSSCPAGWTTDTNAPGTCYQPSIAGTSATLNGIVPGTNYIGWVHAENAAGVNWNSYPSTNWFSCLTP